jgi:nitrogen fixation NifU-like protein
MADLNELYQQVILDHNKSPRNFRVLEQPAVTQLGHNPLCGDQLTLYLQLEGDVVTEVGFQGSGCAISKASASMMTTMVKGKTREEIKTMFGEFTRMVKGELDPETEANHLGRLKIFAGVRQFPARVKCASLSWHTVHAALSENHQAVSTE